MLVTALFLALGSMSVWVEAPPGPSPEVEVCGHNVVCAGVEGDGGSSSEAPPPPAPGCVPGADDGPCWTHDCEVLPLHDGDSPYGVSWTQNPADEPRSMAFARHLGLVDPLVEYRHPDGGRAGFFSETGYWQRCGTTDTDTTEFLPSGEYNSAFEQAASVTFEPVGALVDLLALREQARARSAPPQPAQVGRTPLDGGQTIVKLPTWFWVEDQYWQPYVGSDTSDGRRITVRVTATPVDTTWVTGEGTLVCDQGVEWVSNSPLDPWTGSNCMIEYQHSTTIVAQGHHDVSATVRFETTWALDFDGYDNFLMGQLDDQTSVDGYELKVGEIQALIVNPDRPIEDCFHCDGTTEIADF